MADSAMIGALRVALSLDSAQFSTGIKKAQSGLDRLASASKVAFAAVAAAGASAAITLAFATKRAADHADELGKTAQKIGVTVEALSRLEFAAKLSDVSLEQLSTGLRKLSQNMLEVASGRGAQAKQAFDALGITVTDAAGKLRSADVVLTELADRFSRMEDGSLKTALAMNTLGRSGAELIPLLNEGATGLKAMSDESDRLGLTLNTRTVNAAEGFNDSLTRIQAAFDGIANQILVAVTPGMEQLSAAVSNPEFQQAMVQLAQSLVTIATQMANIVALGPKFVALINLIASAGTSAGTSLPALLGTPAAPTGGPTNDIVVGGGNGGPAPFEPIITGLKQAQEAIDPFAARMEELSQFLVQTHDPFEQMKLDLTDLKTMWDQGRISTEQYGEAVRRVNMAAAISTLDSLSQITGALAGAFKDNKAIAAANVAVSTAAGAMKALEQGGIFGFAGAAAIVAAGVFQLHQILTTTPGNASTPSTGSGGRGEASAPTPGAGTSVHITMEGDNFSREAMQGLFEGLSGALADKGIKFVTSPIGG